MKDDSNYMFRSIAAIIRFSSESMVVVFYRIGMGMYFRILGPLTNITVVAESRMKFADHVAHVTGRVVPGSGCRTCKAEHIF